MKYPKIETLYNRDKDTFKVVPGQLRKQEFGLINRWIMTEKVDGMNIRVILFPDGHIEFRGRTDKAQLPKELEKHLTKTFTCDKMYSVFDRDEHGLFPTIVLYGEGYGPKIQKGGIYRDTQSFRLFDVRIGDWWQDWDSVMVFAKSLEIQTVPYVGVLVGGLPDSIESLERIIPTSYVAAQDGTEGKVQSEGIVARTDPLLLTRSGQRLMWKLKFRDF